MSSQLCIECGKEFRSFQALYGHLRSHPEGNYRETNPTTLRNFVRQKRKDMDSGGSASGTTTSSSPALQVLSLCPPDQTPPPVKKMHSSSNTHIRRYPSDASSIYNLSILAAASSSLSTLQVNPPPQPHISHNMPPLLPAVWIGRHLAKLDLNSSSSSAMQKAVQVNPPTQPHTSHDMPPLPTAICIGRHLAKLDLNSSSSAMQEARQVNPPPQPHTSHDMPPLPTAICIGRRLAKLDLDSSSSAPKKAMDSQSDESDTNSSSSAMQESFLHLDKSKALGSRLGKATGHP